MFFGLPGSRAPGNRGGLLFFRLQGDLRVLVGRVFVNEEGFDAGPCPDLVSYECLKNPLVTWPETEMVHQF